MTNKMNLANFFSNTTTPEQTGKNKKTLKSMVIITIALALVFITAWAVGGANAIDNALAHAGITSDQVSFIRFELDLDDMLPRYEVKWYQGMQEVEYTVHAFTGQLLEIDYD